MILTAEQPKVLEICKSPLPISKLLEIVHRSDRTKFKKNILNPLIDSGLIVMTHPDKPNSPKQKYKATVASFEAVSLT